MVKRELTEKEIVEFLEKKGFHEVTAEEKKSTWYKSAFAWPDCFKGKAKTPRVREHGKKTAV